MTEKTFTLTVEQVKDIYRAGIRRGEDETSAFDWGSTASGGKFDELYGEMHIIANEGKRFDSEDYVDYDTVKSWFKE